MNFVSQLSLSTHNSFQASAADRPCKSIVSRFALAAILLVTMGFAQRSAAQANVALTNASAAFSQTNDSAWTLKKTGTVNTSTSTITWTITATEGTTVAGHLVVDGFVTIVNGGSLGAPIGNIVVNLQTKSGSSWITESSDIADATHGAAATTAYIDAKASSEHKGTFSTNTASGKVEFMDANSNTAFSLKPEVTIAPGATVNLLFSAVFNNTVLKLAAGTAVRAEVIVSFGNSTWVPPSAHDVDINGNGVIDPDEVWVRSVPARLAGTVPPETAVNGSPTLTDAATDITATGTAKFSNPQFMLGVTTGTVTVNYNGGASGGSITNCAHLKSPDSTVTVGGVIFTNVAGLNLQACDTETIASSPVTAGWQDGQMVTYSQASYGGSSTAEQLLLNNYVNLYPNVFEIGLASGGYNILFTSAAALQTFMPQTGPVGVLTSSLIDPTSSAAGGFAGVVAALKLDIDFSDAGVLKGTSNLKFGDLTLCNISSPTGLNGTTVRNFLTTANTELGGGSTSFTATDLTLIANQLGGSFAVGKVSTWAQQHLFNGACPVWKAGDLTSYSQLGWTQSPGSSTLSSDFFSIYTTGAVDVGGTYLMEFTSASAILAYLPATNSPSALNSNVQNPTSTVSGIFGGDVLALSLDIAFSDAGKLTGTTGYKFGDLTLCGLSPASLNGQTIRQYSAIVNAVLGGGSSGGFTGADIGTLEPITDSIAGAFNGGTPSTFAQLHLRHGACQ